MTSDATETGQLSIPLGADAFWADLADEEQRRDVDAAQKQASSTEVYTLIPLEQWRQDQTAQPDAAVDAVLQQGHLYEIDGGIFKAKQQDGRWELWTWQGHNGNDVGTRNGFEVDGASNLYERLYDVNAEESLVMTPARFVVTDLVTIDPSLPVYGSEAAAITGHHNGRQS